MGLLSDKPSAYQKGYIEFYKLKFKVTPDVLISRPETELLVDEVLNFSNLHPPTSNLTIMDVGTGAGNIAISIAKNSTNVEIIATDISPKALKIAKQNAKLHGVEKNIIFIYADLLKVKQYGVRSHKLLIIPDIIVTNLPYIPTQRIPHLDSSVKDFEPHVALDGGKDGFELYRKLFAQISKKGLKPKLIVGEIDYTHSELAVIEAQRFFPNAKVEVKTDLAHKQRILTIKEI